MKVRSALRGLIGMGKGNDVLILRNCTFDQRPLAEPCAANHRNAAATAGFGAPVIKTYAGDDAA
jgi:hypothetical protein